MSGDGGMGSPEPPRPSDLRTATTKEPDRRGQLRHARRFIGSLEPDPAAVAPLLERPQNRWQVDLTCAQRCRPAPPGVGSRDSVGQMHIADVGPERFHCCNWIVAMHEE